jgi:hypothetical protein
MEFRAAKLLKCICIRLPFDLLILGADASVRNAHGLKRAPVGFNGQVEE